MKFVKKLVKWSFAAAVVSAAYGAGRMNPPRTAGRFERFLGKGRK